MRILFINAFIVIARSNHYVPPASLSDDKPPATLTYTNHTYFMILPVFGQWTRVGEKLLQGQFPFFEDDLEYAVDIHNLLRALSLRRIQHLADATFGFVSLPDTCH